MLGALALSLMGMAADDRVLLLLTRDAAAAACPDEGGLQALVNARIGSEAFVDARAPEPRRTMVVEFTGVAGRRAQVVARLVLLTRGQAGGVRTLRGAADCTSLAAEVALAMAIAIDPLLLLRRAPTAAADVEAAASPPPAPRPDEAADEERASATTTYDVAAEAATQGRPRALVERLATRAGLGVSAFTAPVAVPSLRAELSAGSGPLDVDVALRFDLPTRTPIGGSGQLDMTTLAVALSPCAPLHFSDSLGVRALRICGVGEAGVLAAQGVGLETPRAQSQPWIAVGARAALDVEVWRHPGTPRAGDARAAAVVAQIDGLVPLVRPRYVDTAAPEVLYHQPGALALVVSVGVALSIR